MSETNPPPGWARADVIRLHRLHHGKGASRGFDACPSHHWIVLGHDHLVGHRRLLERWAGSASVPLSLCSFDHAPCLVEEMVELGERLGMNAMHLVVEPEARRYVPPSVRHRVEEVSAPAEVGTAIGVLVPLVLALVRDPSCTVVVAPHDTGWLRAKGLARALAYAQARVEVENEIVMLGVEPGLLSPWGGDEVPGRPWLVPFGSRGEVTDVPVARIVTRARRLEAYHLEASGALCATGFVVASGMRLLELFEDLTPRLLRLFLFGAGMPPGERATYFARALQDLGPLDLAGDLLASSRHLRAVVVPDSAGLSELRGEMAAAVWLARRRSAAEPRGHIYRRVTSRDPLPSPCFAPPGGTAGYARVDRLADARRMGLDIAPITTRRSTVASPNSTSTAPWT